MSLLGWILLLAPVQAEVYLSAEQAVQKAFPGLDEFKAETLLVEGQEFKVFKVLRQGQTFGWAVQIEEMAKRHPVTFLVGIDKELKVQEVYVLEYRDMFGDQIKRKSFLRQFIGKSRNDPIMLGRDIDAVTQATISSQSATEAVKKALKLIEKIK